MAPPEGTRLCALADIADGESARFTGPVDGTAQPLLAVRRGDRVFVYVNSCPHTGAPLDFLPGRFLNVERTHIQCANHGALFRIDDGLCLHGPCVGKNLHAVAARIEDGSVYLDG